MPIWDRAPEPSDLVGTTQTQVETLVETRLPIWAAGRGMGRSALLEEHLRFYSTCVPRCSRVLRRAVEATGCGFLLDLSHAQLAARVLGIDPYAYIEALPVTRIREIHVTGVQRFEGIWVDRARTFGVEESFIEQVAGQYLDHLPMIDEDWEILSWALDRIREGAWATPQIVAYECGGIGPLFAATTIPEVLAEQVPRLYDMVHAGD